MVLGALILHAVTVIFASVLAVTLSSAAEQHRVAGYAFTLKQEVGRCVVSFVGTEHSGRLTLAPEPPCEFVRSESGGLKYFKYNDVGVDAVIIVIGNPLTNDEKRSWKDAEGLFCGKTTQALLVRPQGVLVSSEIMRGGVVCATSGVDEKRFYQFAHPIKMQGRGPK